MAITKEKKKELLQQYKDLLAKSKNVVIMEQSFIPVNEINKVRKDIINENGYLQVVKKRLFIKALEEQGYEGVDSNDFVGSVIVLYSLEDEFKPLKVLNKILKGWRKSKAKYMLNYLGGFYDKQWKDSEYVKSIAELPTKDELVAQFAFLLKYPIKAFAMDLKQIADKQENS